MSKDDTDYTAEGLGGPAISPHWSSLSSTPVVLDMGAIKAFRVMFLFAPVPPAS